MDVTRQVPLFAALADETRLALLDRLAREPMLSIARLSDGAAITRQAITKHLRILESVGLVRAARHGRETRYQLDPSTIDEARAALDTVARQWDHALASLKSHIEENP